MITEDYVSFETAKILKEKGFSKLTTKAYPYFEGKDYKYDISCPTLQMAMKWLLEMFGLCILIQVVDNGFSCSIFKVERDGEGWIRDSKELNHSVCFDKTCDGAWECAIKYCLENYV